MSQAAAVVALPEPLYRLEQNADGTAIVRLRDPVKLGNEQLSRLTIPRITGRHMRAATWVIGEPPTMGQVVDWAAAVVEPLGVLDELDASLARDLATEVAMLLMGKSRTTGGPSSPT